MRRRLEELLPKLVLVFCLLVAGAVSVVLWFSEDHEAKRQSEALRKLAAETALYPGFQQVMVSDDYKHERARLFLYYRSAATYDEVKEFYSKALTGKGWQIYPKEGRRGLFSNAGDDVLVLRNKSYQIAIFHESPEQSSERGNYVIAYLWEGS